MPDRPLHLREAAPTQAALLAAIISEANRDVAERFGLDAKNCPKHPSLCTPDWILRDMDRGERYFLAILDAEAVGCVALRVADAATGYLNRLAVRPAYRRQGIGAALVEHVLDLARNAALRRVSLGTIDEHTELRRWYERLGFAAGETRRFEHLPFVVRYMSCTLQPARDRTAAPGERP